MNQAARLEISRKIEKGEPFSITFRFADNQFLMIINSIIGKILSKTDKLFLHNSFITIIREIVVNAQKANAKRIYFIKNGLNIKEPAEYIEGMKLFKDQVIGAFETIEDDLKKSDFFIKLMFGSTGSGMDIVVQNNAPLLPEELKRINLRIQKAIEYNDFTEAYEEIQDESEGAGLGIVLTILFLKNMGIPPTNFTMTSNERITQTRIHVPNELRSSMITTTFEKDIVREVEGIPTFPENVTILMEMCTNPEIPIEKLANKIQEDPAISTDVIKLSNSAGFFPTKRVESVSNAVMTIGLKNVEAILMASNARKILDKRYSSFESIWKHCNKTAFYARQIALKKHIPVVEQAFVGGLLHDLGKIILLSTDMNMVKRIAEQVKDRKIISSTIMEEISVGLSHSSIGGLIAEKWQFPEYLIETIKYHHAPLNASKEYRDIVQVVYLANMFCGIEERRYSYYYFDEDILERFDISEQNAFNKFHEFLKNKYEDMGIE